MEIMNNLQDICGTRYSIAMNKYSSPCKRLIADSDW